MGGYELEFLYIGLTGSDLIEKAINRALLVLIGYHERAEIAGISR